tara:strand:- start:213 stop:572 length:360 start_codon:yes stop_codon:yes gene_type:complete
MKKLITCLSLGLGGSLLFATPYANAHDWVEYGSLKVNIRGWKINQDRLQMDGKTTYDTNYINTSKNTEGYISIDCGRNRLATTDSNGNWRRYRVSIRKNEKNLKDDFCTAIRKNPLLFN